MFHKNNKKTNTIYIILVFYIISNFYRAKFSRKFSRKFSSKVIEQVLAYSAAVTMIVGSATILR